MRLQITVDENLGNELQARANELGLSISSYVRAMLKKSTSKPNILDKAISEESEKISLEELKKQIKNMM